MCLKQFSRIFLFLYVTCTGIFYPMCSQGRDCAWYFEKIQLDPSLSFFYNSWDSTCLLLYADTILLCTSMVQALVHESQMNAILSFWVFVVKKASILFICVVDMHMNLFQPNSVLFESEIILLSSIYEYNINDRNCQALQPMEAGFCSRGKMEFAWS